MLSTSVCDVLGIIYPIIQGGMAWAATGELAAAVSAAGGLGVIGAGSAPPEIVRQEIEKVRNQTTRPFGVNIYYMSPYVEELIDLVIAEKVPVVTTGAGNPGKQLPRLKAAGIKVVPVVASVTLAKRLERLGVDAVIAEGMECGGHVGEICTMPLVTQIVAAVDIPVIAAGGIACGRGLAAALALGADGIQMGTRFICAEECTVHINFKKAILKAKDRDTVVTGFPGHYVRVLKNKLTREFERLTSLDAVEEMERLGAGRLRAAVVEGDVDFGSLMAGQIAAMVKEIKPAAAIVQEIMLEAETVINHLAARVKEA